MARNGTGLTNPAFFNWEINAQQEVAARDPDAVVMAIGDNDGFNVQTRRRLAVRPRRPRLGDRVRPARRRRQPVLSGDGKRPVYWVAPRPRAIPTSTGSSPARTARRSEPHGRSHAALRGRVLHAERRALQRQPEGRRPARPRRDSPTDPLHARRAVAPRRLILAAMAEDYPACGADEARTGGAGRLPVLAPASASAASAACS